MGTPLDPSINWIDNIYYGIERLSRGAPLWGLAWSAMAAFAWHIWRERNMRWHEIRAVNVAKLLEDIIADLKLTFRESRYKAAQQMRFEAESYA